MSTDYHNQTQPNQMESQVSYEEDQQIQYEHPSQVIGNKFNVSVASLGDIYKFTKDKGEGEQYDLLNYDENDTTRSRELKRYQRDPNTGRPSSSMVMKKKGQVNNVFLNPYSIQTEPNEKAIKKSRVVEVNYLHMTTLPDSKKFEHVAQGRINPPKSTFSVKNIIETNQKNHEDEMRPIVLYPNRVRIGLSQNDTKRNQDNAIKENEWRNDKASQEQCIIIGNTEQKGKTSNKHKDNHVQFTQSKEAIYKPRALSSKKARKALLVSEKFVGAVQDYFRSNEMKIPSKTSIDNIASYAKNVEQTLDRFASEIESNKAKQGKYEDPFRKKLKKKKLIKPNPPKIYPIIENNYQRKVEEKLAKLQIDLRQIFDALSTQGSAQQGDDEKVRKMISQAKKLTNLITHLKNDVITSKQMHIKEMKEKNKENKEKGGERAQMKTEASKEKLNIVQASQAKINQSIQLDNLNISTMPNTQPQVTESQVIQQPQQQQPAMNNKKISNVYISAINPVQESMINTIGNNYNDSIIQTVQSLDKTKANNNNNNTKESFNITNQQLQQGNNYNNVNEKSMTLPNYNATMPTISNKETQKTTTTKSQIEFNPLFSYSKNMTTTQQQKNPLYTSSSSNDPNITLNNYQVEASKIKLDIKHPILDDRFSAFNIEMPAQYYFEVSKDREPTTEKEWYIRPHHTETFTPNEQAIPDDILNTKYISYYGPIEKKETKTRQELIEEMIGETRSNIDQLQYNMFTQSQFDKDKEQLYAKLEKLKEEAKKDYVPGQFLDKEKKNEKITALLQSGEPKTFSEMFEGNEQIHQTNFAIDTYSKLRSEVRNKEHQLLLQKRKEEYERIRPPKAKWYELKGAEFQEEMQRNKMVINAGAAYFEKIKQLTNNDLY